MPSALVWVVARTASTVHTPFSPRVNEGITQSRITAMEPAITRPAQAPGTKGLSCTSSRRLTRKSTNR